MPYQRALHLSLLFLAGWACSRGPDASRPWVVVLDLAAQREDAENSQRQLLEKLQGKTEPQLLELNHRGLQYFAVTSSAFANRLQAEDLARSLEGESTLSVMDIRGRLPQGQGRATVLDSAPSIEKLLLRLPAPGAWQLESLQFLAGRPDCRLQVFSPQAFLFSRWCALGFESMAEAAYQDGSGRQVLVLAGQGFSSGQPLTEAVASLVMGQVAPDDGQWQAQQKARRGGGKKTRLLPQEEEKLQLPQPQMRQLPWGEQEIFSLERFFPQPMAAYRPGQNLFQAWLLFTHEASEALLALAQEESQLAELFRPRGLGPARGMRFEERVLDVLALHPEVLPEGEALAALQFLPAWRLAGVERKSYPDSFCHRLEFRGRDWFWRINRLELSDQQKAAQLYESAFVDARRKRIQALLDSKQKINYQISLQLVELGEVNGWHFRGVAGERSEEIYFQKDNEVFWIEAQNLSEQDPEGGLPGRVSLLPIW